MGFKSFVERLLTVPRGGGSPKGDAFVRGICVNPIDLSLFV